MLKHLDNKVMDWLIGLGIQSGTARIISDFGLFIIIVVLSLITFTITRRILIKVLHNLTLKSKTNWDDILIEKRFFSKVSYLVPAFIIYSLSPFVLKDYPFVFEGIQIFLKVYMIIVVLLAINAFLNAIATIYDDFTIAKSKPIKGYIQIVKIFVYILGAIVIIASLIQKNPLGLLGGLGAFSAVLLLVFKDPILGFVGGIQLSANNMVKPGDWITMPKYDADGTVIDIALTTVKVQNWDKTISTIPTYSLIESSFKNWRGMEESGGRRIKRSINIDMKSIKFCTPEMLAKYQKYQYVENYVKQTQAVLEEFNKKNHIDDSVLVNGRRQTNIGVFRAYLNGYLKNHPKIHNEMTFLVRQLQPTDKGLPIEIYVFSKIQEWAKYEDLQSDIFDHVLAVVPEFELKIFQNPSGDDFQKLIN